MIPDYPTSPLHCQAYCKKDILVRGDMTEEMSDIVEKFIKVAHGPEALEDNRARENARENIRQVLYIALMLVLVNWYSITHTHILFHACNIQQGVQKKSIDCK